MKYLLLILSVFLFLNCRITAPINQTPLDTLDDYGIKIRSGDRYYYTLSKGFFGPGTLPDDSITTNIKSYEKADFYLVIGDIINTANIIRINVAIEFKGEKAIGSQRADKLDTTKIDTIYFGYVDYENNIPTQKIDGFSLQLFKPKREYISDSSGLVYISGEQLHFTKDIDSHSILGKKMKTTSSYDAFAYHIIENSLLLKVFHSIAMGCCSGGYNIDLVSVNGTDVTIKKSL